MNRHEFSDHVCGDTCLQERARLAPLDTYFAQCIEGRAQLRVSSNEQFECPRVQREFETLCALCSIAAMTRPRDLRNED